MANILITGGGKRIGRHLSIAFAQIGWNVAIHYNQSEEMAKQTYEDVCSFGAKAVLVQADVRSRKEVSKAVATASEYLGGLDVLVNNAGVFPASSALADISEELWDDTLDINLRGEFYFAQSFAQIAQENARIINISSVGGSEVWRGRLPYNVSKAGVIQLTKALAIELAPKISVNCVAPGIIEMKDESPDEVFSVSTARIPMKRYGSTRDIFDAVRFFAEASGYITGQVLNVDGGYHLSR